MSGSTYVIWSHEHGAWWARPSGYTARLSEARHFNMLQALALCMDAMPGTAGRLGALPDIPVRFIDVALMRASFLTRFADVDEAWM